MSALRFGLVAAVLAAATAYWFHLDDGWDTGAEPIVAAKNDPAPASAPNYAARSNVVAPRQAVDPARSILTSAPLPPAPSDAERSPLADELHTPRSTGLQDIAVVMNLFTEYRARFRSFPVGEDNASFVHALTGHNPGKLALLPRDHPAIDAQGRLLDRWGHPFFFHLLGRDALEVRSAGPDGELYTADDLLQGSP